MTDTAVIATDDLDAPPANIDTAALLERVVIVGDLAKLKPEHRVIYYREVCQSLGLNPLTRPFSYIVLNGKLTLYANRTATDQLRSNHGISIDSIDHAEVGELYIATVHGHDRQGRRDSEVGAVNIANLRGDNRANAIMKAITKAKRRLTLSLAGLGWLDDSEVGTMPDAAAIDVDPDTGAIEDPTPSLTDAAAAKLAAITDDAIEGEVVESSGPAAPPANGSEGGEVASASSGEPPHPAHAGARGAVDVSAGNPMPAPDAEGQPSTTADPSRCPGFSAELGRCEREEEHAGLHRNKDTESWS